MGLITCPQCGQSVSDSAATCIHCGCKLRQEPTSFFNLPIERQELLNKVKVSNKNKLSKRIATLVLTSAMMLAPLGLTACSASCTNCQGLFIPSQQTTPGGTSNGKDDENGNTDTQSKHSKIMDAVMLNDYYNDLVQQAENNHLTITPNMRPVPYKFLQQQGHDVDAYLDGTLNAFASSYIFDNDKNHIYVSVKAENVSYHEYGNYYTNYVLQYPLTNQEYEDYNIICKEQTLQALLFIQELDNQKTPEIVNEINIAVSSYDKMITGYSSSFDINFNKYYKVDVDVYTCNRDELVVSIREAGTSTKYTSKIGKIKLLPSILVGYTTYDNNVKYMSRPDAVNYGNLEEYQCSVQDITAYSYGYSIRYTNPSFYTEDYKNLL